MQRAGPSLQGPASLYEDAIGRLWQLTTVQFDFNLPDRFGIMLVLGDREIEQGTVAVRERSREDLVWSGLLVTKLAAPPITARNERLKDTMMVRADIDRTWQIDGCRVSLMPEGVHAYSPVLMLGSRPRHVEEPARRQNQFLGEVWVTERG